MAAAVSSPWGKPGAWALDSEEHEADLKKDDSINGDGRSTGSAADGSNDFPSLSAAASTKTKKKKAQTLSLQQFATYGSAPAAAANKGLTPDELSALPTGPRQRTSEELDRSKLGGGFRSYGSNYDRPSRDESRRQGGFNRDSNREFAPSKADEIDDWGAAKKSSVGGGFERRERGGFFSDSLSKADESDNWADNKAFVPSQGRRSERRGGFGSGGGGADSDSWGKKKEEEGRRFGGSFDSLRERRGSLESLSGGPDSDSWGKKREEGSGGTARPRLNLQPRSLPVGEVQQNGSGTGVKAKGSNPFGAARPREEVLKDKGQDWKEIDQKLESLKVKEAADVPSFGRKGFGNSNGRPSLPEVNTQRSWRKPDSVDARPTSAETTESGPVEEAEDGNSQV